MNNVGPYWTYLIGGIIIGLCVAVMVWVTYDTIKKSKVKMEYDEEESDNDFNCFTSSEEGQYVLDQTKELSNRMDFFISALMYYVNAEKHFNNDERIQMARLIATASVEMNSRSISIAQYYIDKYLKDQSK